MIDHELGRYTILRLTCTPVDNNLDVLPHTLCPPYTYIPILNYNERLLIIYLQCVRHTCLFTFDGHSERHSIISIYLRSTIMYTFLTTDLIYLSFGNRDGLLPINQ